MEWIGPLLALSLLVTVVALLSPDFRKPENVTRLLNQWSFKGIVAVGMTLVILVGGIDLSVGSMVALLGGLAIYSMNAAVGGGADPAMGIALAACVALLGGPLLGAVNGIAVTLGRIAPFIATLGTMVAFRSIIVAVADGSEVPSRVSGFGAMGTGGVEVPLIRSSRGGAVTLTYPTLAFFGTALLAHLVLTRTAFGRRVYAVGDNPLAARYAGVNVSRVRLGVYMIAGLTCGLAGLLNGSRMSSIASSQTGQLDELDAIAAVVIGGTRIGGGAGSVTGTVIGVVTLAVIQNMLNMLNVSPHLHGLVKGCIILAAVLVQRNRARA